MKKICITLLAVSSLLFSQLFINEIDYDQPSTDAAEFVEIAGPAGIYNNVRINLVNGNNGSVYDFYEFDTIVLANENNGYGLFVLGVAGVPNVDATGDDTHDLPATNAIQNGAPDGIEVLIGGAIVDAVSYEGPMNDTEFNPMEMATDASIYEGNADESIGRLGLDEFPWAVGVPTPGMINDGQVFSDDVNLPPTAVAGDDQLVNSGDPVTLDGSGSYDSDGMIVYYLWTQTAGPTVTLSDPESDIVTFTAPESAEPLVFELLVFDDAADSDTDEVEIMVCSAGVITIAQARALGSGACATVEGVVNSPNFQLGNVNSEYSIQDETGGIVLFLPNEDLGLMLGDRVQVAGSIDEYNGKKEIIPGSTEDVQILGNEDPPTSQLISVAELIANGEDYESEVITIENVNVVSGTWPGSGSSSNLMITDDGSSEVTMRIDSDTDLDGSEEPDWPAIVTGVAGQYDSSEPYNSGYQLLPRYLTDFEESNLPVADAGGDQLVDPGVLVTLDGSGSYDPMGLNIVGYIWEQTGGVPVTLSDYEEPVVTFTSPDENATLVFRLTVVNEQGDSGWDNVSIVVVASETTIYDVQFTEDIGGDCYDSPYLAQSVTLTGFVTAVDGTDFYLQDPDFDSYAGVYYYSSGFTPTVGDELTVTANVTEYFGLTEMANVSAHSTNSSGNTITPKDISTVELMGGCSIGGESLEGMLVRVSNVTVTVAPNTYGEWFVDDGSGPCQIDDGMFVGQTPSPLVGDMFDAIVGVVGYGYSEYELLPRNEADLGGGGVDPTPVSIYDIQHSTDMGSGEDCYPSAYNGQVITTIGVVTAVKPDAAFPHFFIQQLDAPEFGGVYVYVTDGFEMLSLNDEVTLTAEVDEYYGLTELKNIENYSTAPCDCVVTPTPITTGLLGIECSMMAEGFEGMLVYLENVTVESVDEFGNWFINDGSGTAMVDDYIFDGEMPVPLAGDTFASITGTVDFNFGEYKIMPRNIDDIVAAEEECVADGDVTGDGNTDVLDIVAVVGHILGTNPLDWAVVCHADTDGSEIIDVLDIVAIIDMILNPTARNADATRANVRISTNGATLTADGFIGGVQMTLKHGPEFSLGLTENCYLAESNTENGETRLVILHPQGELFTTDGEYTIEEISVVSSSDYVETVIAEAFTLLWNYPNPFNPQTQINYSVAGNGPVQLAIFDLMGHEVAQLVNQVQNAGTSYSVIWNGTNEAGIDVPSGIYFARLSSAGKVTTSKLTLLR